LALLLLSFTGSLFAQNTANKADSIIKMALEYREFYGKHIRECSAQIYIKGGMQVEKKNRLFRYAPYFLYWDRKGANTFVEAIVDVHYTAPNYFANEIKALNGNKLTGRDIQERVMRFLNVNIYHPTIFDDLILLPDAKNVFDYYRFEYVASFDTLKNTIHQIKVIPKVKSRNLISGFFYIADKIWTVYRIDVTGQWEFSDFRVQTDYGLQWKNFLLPLNTAITFHTNLLGNETVTNYFSNYQYHSVKRHDWKENDTPVNYDLSNYFDIQTDSVPIVRDSLFWNKNRPIPLSLHEKSFFETGLHHRKPLDTTIIANNQLYFSQGILAPKKFKYNNVQFSYSGLLNPLKLAYSKLDGITYWQQLKLNKQFKTGQELQVSPNIGILFRRKEVYFNTPVQWLFAPKKFGTVYFTFGNRNQSYNSTIIDKINEEIDGKTPNDIDFDDLHLDYFHHFHTALESGYELANGLLLQGGIDYDWYVAVKEKNAKDNILRDSEIDDDIIDIIEKKYRAFVPVIGLIWTPHQYYRMNGKRKEYLNSRFPTFSVAYARGIKNIFKSNSYFERIEVDVQQKIPVSLMRSFHYYAGTGWFSNTESIYFADFENFQRRNIPQSWDDPIGGVFHLLPVNQYNASNMYIQGHFMYESPFVILRLFKGVAKDILKERIYVSQLYTPVTLPCYTEIGYGVGNFFANAGVFVAFNRGKYKSVGVKFEFEMR
jgi:hypothetical protein